MDKRLLEITIDEEGEPNIYLNGIKIHGARQNYAWCMVDKCFWEEVIKMFWVPTGAYFEEDCTETRERVLPLKQFLERMQKVWHIS